MENHQFSLSGPQYEKGHFLFLGFSDFCSTIKRPVSSLRTCRKRHALKEETHALHTEKHKTGKRASYV